ncbi:MAG: hypothetical protein ACYCWW_08625 [Deltaproteobacteria bacterium]
MKILPIAVLVLSLAGCAGNAYEMLPTTREPAAQGHLKTKETSNGNTQIKLLVQHLAPANKLSEGATTYVVWVRPAGGDGKPLNVGALKVDSDLEGELVTVTSFSRFTVFVTAEADSQVTAPSGVDVLSSPQVKN